MNWILVLTKVGVTSTRLYLKEDMMPTALPEKAQKFAHHFQAGEARVLAAKEYPFYTVTVEPINLIEEPYYAN